jgi:hypothetical protein
MKTSNALFLLFLPVALLLVATVAGAAPRTLCYQIQFRDERTDCPLTNTTGNLRGCNGGTATDYTDLVGGLVEIWDRDDSPPPPAPPNPDDYIGSWIIGGNGVRCSTFEWGTGIGESETNPDLYVKWYPQVRSTNGTGAMVRAQDFNGNNYGPNNFRDIAVFNNCATGSNCTFGSAMTSTGNSNTDLAQAYQMVDSAQHVLQLYGDTLDNAYVNVRYPGSAIAPAGDGCNVAGRASTQDQYNFCLGSTGGFDGDHPTHEMGHVVQLQMFEQPDLRNECGGSWGLGTASTNREDDSCTTTEGWASYVGGRAWYNSATTTVFPLYSSLNLEDATFPGGSCDATDAELPRQAAKAFWDLDDTNNEPGSSTAAADASDFNSLIMADIWDSFLSGTANRQDYENSVNGVNLYVYLSYTSGGGVQQTFMDHNCMTAQVP